MQSHSSASVDYQYNGTASNFMTNINIDNNFNIKQKLTSENKLCSTWQSLIKVKSMDRHISPYNDCDENTMSYIFLNYYQF